MNKYLSDSAQRMYGKVGYVAINSRRAGNTEYLLRAALRNPRVTIVCRSADYCEQVRKRYRKIVQGLPWYQRLWRWVRRTPEPQFMSLNSPVDRALSGRAFPVVFDNSALYWE